VFLVIVMIVVVAVEVAVMVMVPMMVVLKAAVISIPVANEVLFSIMVRSNPMSAFVWRLGPIARVPLVVVSHRIPVTVDPNKGRPGSDRRYGNYAWRWRSADSDSDGDLGLRHGYAQKQNEREEQCCPYETFHVT
jgi:hypothetical protein